MVPSAGSAGVAVALTELRDPDGFEGALRAALSELDGEAAGNFDLRFVVDPTEETSSGEEILLWIADDLLVVSRDVAGLQAVSRTIASGSRFVESRLSAAVWEAATNEAPPGIQTS